MSVTTVTAKVRSIVAALVAAAKSVGVNWRPVRKVAVHFLAAAIAWVALRVGVDLGTAAVNEAAVVIIGAVAGWLVPSSK